VTAVDRPISIEDAYATSDQSAGRAMPAPAKAADRPISIEEAYGGSQRPISVDEAYGQDRRPVSVEEAYGLPPRRTPRQPTYPEQSPEYARAFPQMPAGIQSAPPDPIAWRTATTPFGETTQIPVHKLTGQMPEDVPEGTRMMGGVVARDSGSPSLLPGDKLPGGLKDEPPPEQQIIRGTGQGTGVGNVLGTTAWQSVVGLGETFKRIGQATGWRDFAEGGAAITDFASKVVSHVEEERGGDIPLTLEAAKKLAQETGEPWADWVAKRYPFASGFAASAQIARLNQAVENYKNRVQSGQPPDPDDMRHIGQAAAEMEGAGIRGREVTPFLLARLGELSEGRTLESNVALLENNVRLGCAVAHAIAKGV